jgi:putative heme-binding domain-containing protein
MTLRHSAALLLLAPAGFASQPTSTKDLPDPNPEVQKATFVLPEGFEINAFATDPLLRKPVQMNWDSAGRLWVVSSTTYPHIKPGEEAKDQVVVLEDTNNDGVADKSTVFTEDLHIPTAVMPGDGGVYIANSTEVVFMRDTDGDLKADEKRIILSGFGTEDTHHLLHTMRQGPEGLLYFLQSIYIHSHVETPYGVRRLLGGGVWEFRPETRRLEVISKGLVNPWGFEFDRWGQSFAADGAGSEGVNYIFPGSVFISSPGAARILHGMSPGQPKQSGQEIIEDPHFPADWQGNVIQCDFRGNRINRFKLTPSGSGYVAKQEADVLASTHRAFRPIDVRVGPDGALYIADWYNPIIQHGEVDFRDERRDHVHGRIWRLTSKTRPLSEKPVFSGKSAEELVGMLSSDRKYVRHFAKRELRDMGAEKVLPAVDKVVTEDEHLKLELAWAREGVNSFSPALWRTVWAAKDSKARAAALRILTHRWKELPEHMKVLEAAVADESAQVRLWALAVADQIRKPAAVELALRVLDQSMDVNQDFLLEQICREQADTWLPQFTAGKLKLSNAKHMIYALKATGKPEALTPLLVTLKSGKLNGADAGAVLSVAASSMDAAQAKELAELANASAEPRILDALVSAAVNRAIVPEGAEAYVMGWIAHAKQEMQHRACILAGAWKLEAARETLVKLLQAADTPKGVRQGAVQGLTKLGGVKSRDALDAIFPTHPALAISGLVDVGPVMAAQRAVQFLATAQSSADATQVIAAFLKDKKLPGLLAKELQGKSLPEAIALEGMRAVSSRGVKGPLEAAFQKAGGIKAMDQALTPEAMAAMVEKVKTQGSASRGEQIYRRQQLLCMSCHAIGETGGLLGPNMVSIGASAPVDYLIESLLNPSAKIKEGYHTVLVTLKDGKVTTGGMVTDGAEEIVIRDPANQLIKIAKSNVASSQMIPTSMMPPGLTASLRQDEFVDLVKFLSELGREGDFKTPPNKYVRNWKTMGVMQQADIDHVRHVGLHALSEKGYNYPWEPKYSRVNGDLPLSELPVPVKMYPWFPRIAQFSLKSAEAGKVKLKLSHTQGILVVAADKLLAETTAEMVLDLKAGSTPVTIIAQREGAGDLQNLRIEILEGIAVVE